MRHMNHKKGLSAPEVREMARSGRPKERLLAREVIELRRRVRKYRDSRRRAS